MGRPCACCKKDCSVCWNTSGFSYDGELFAHLPADDTFVSSLSNIEKDCGGCVLVDYHSDRCPRNSSYPYIIPAKVVKFLKRGGIYFAHCEWDNYYTCVGLEPMPLHYQLRNRRPTACDVHGGGFNTHMEAIGCSIRRDLPTAFGWPWHGHSLGSPLFKGVAVSGNATASLKNGVPLLSLPSGGYNPPECARGGIVCAGEKVHRGFVITFGDSNVQIGRPNDPFWPSDYNEQFRENMFDILAEGINPLDFTQQPLP